MQLHNLYIESNNSNIVIGQTNLCTCQKYFVRVIYIEYIKDIIYIKSYQNKRVGIRKSKKQRGKKVTIKGVNNIKRENLNCSPQ